MKNVCAFCGADEDITELTTYKSIWFQCKSCGCYERVNRERYPLEFLTWMTSLFSRLKLPIISNYFFRLGRLIGHLPQGQDFYSHYTKRIRAAKKNNIKGKWSDQLSRLEQHLNKWEIQIENKKILEISGEPGFLAEDLKKKRNCDILVTAFSKDVAAAMSDNLGVDSCEYSYQEHKLHSIVESKRYEIILVINSIGFCENLQKFLNDVSQVLEDKGYVYISYSPACRALCARWMFIDYTYEVQYSEDFFKSQIKKSGFDIISEWEIDKFRWDQERGKTFKFLSSFYTRKLFSGKHETDLFQVSNALLLQKK